MRGNREEIFSNTRLWVLGSLLLIMMLVLAYRMFHLQILQNHFLQDQGDARTIRVVSIPSHRGVIRDRNGEPLAASTPVDSLWVNPQEVDMTLPEWKKALKILSLDPKKIESKIEGNDEKEFLYLRRHLEPSVAEKVMSLNIPGINMLREYRRYYPDGEVTAHIIGFTDIDDGGQEGLELAYDEWLKGTKGAKRVVKDRMGREVEILEVIRAAEPGKDLLLSIDKRIQYLTYRALKNQVAKHDANGGSAVILDIKTGEVLAMVNQPSFNPNNRERMHDGRYRNRAVTDLFEPGSTMKTFSVVNALEQKVVTPKTIVETHPGFMNLQGHVVRDIHNYGTLDITGILRKSSNIGVTKITLNTPPQTLSTLLAHLGFGLPTDSGFPGESVGTLMFPKANQEFALATLAFGYGVSANPLQLAHAYATLANKGRKTPISFLKQENAVQSEQVIAPEVADIVLEMLAQVVESGGSGTRAKVPGFKVAGKTGTARKIEAKGYSADKHLSLFAGIAPLREPRFAMVIMIDEPKKGEYYGGLVAAPVFAQVMEGALRIMGVPPDPLKISPPLKGMLIEDSSYRGEEE